MGVEEDLLAFGEWVSNTIKVQNGDVKRHR
jgi:hypothetical protein